MTSDRLQILVIDDSLADTHVLRAYLNQACPGGFDLTHTNCAAAGLAALGAVDFDCVFLDYMLDGDSGLELLQQVRASGNDVPIIAISGNGCEEVAVQALKLGAQDYMVKGVLTPEAVERALSNAIEKVALSRQLKEKHQELEEFSYVAAHDLRGPLSSVHMLVSLLLDGACGEFEPEAKKILRRVEASTLNMSHLLDALLDYAETGRSQKPLEPVDLSTVLSIVLENLSARIASTNASVEFTQLPVVMGDDVALTQLLQNLLANAIKFCVNRSPEINITAGFEDGRWTISVTDNGIGIAPRDQQRIFAPFRRLHKAGDFEGCGIGLATCKKIVEQHGGTIGVKSQLGEGTTLYFSLPAVDQIAEIAAPGPSILAAHHDTFPIDAT